MADGPSRGELALQHGKSWGIYREIKEKDGSRKFLNKNYTRGRYTYFVENGRMVIS